MPQINKSFETEDGLIIFNGEVTYEEFDYIIELGLLQLIKNGMITPQIVMDKELH